MIKLYVYDFVSVGLPFYSIFCDLDKNDDSIIHLRKKNNKKNR